MPTVALCNQRVATLEQLLKPLNREVGRAYGGLHGEVLGADTGELQLAPSLLVWQCRCCQSDCSMHVWTESESHENHRFAKTADACPLLH